MPESELSTPEEYLKSIRPPTPDNVVVVEDKAIPKEDEDDEEGMESAVIVRKILSLDSDDEDFVVDIEAPLTNEETPLLS